jgi:hypothetical protein
MTKQDRPPLEARVCRAIRLLAEGQNADDVARAVHVRPATLAAWQADEDFQALLDSLYAFGQARESLDALTDDAIAALHRALAGDELRVAVQAAREVLDRVGLIRRRRVDHLIDPSSEQVIRVEYGNLDRQPVSTPPWADRNPAESGAVQGGGVRSPLRQDGDGQDSDD